MAICWIGAFEMDVLGWGWIMRQFIADILMVLIFETVNALNRKIKIKKLFKNVKILQTILCISV